MTGRETRPLISADIEARILDILDATEPGLERDLAIAELDLSESMAAAVAAWLAEEDPAEPVDDFLQTPASGAPIAAVGTDLPRRMGDYELTRLLGKGGMGIVYAARDLKLGRTVALKVLPGHFADNPKRRQRFEREVRAVAALRHDAIVSVFEAGTLDGTPYFTMELVEGSSLDQVVQRLREQATPVGELRRRHWLAATTELDAAAPPQREGRDRPYVEAVCQLIIDVAEALQHAHDHKVVHRDVKPSNIMISSASSAKLFDFGLARVEDEGAVTRTSELIGSPHYMSPEQVSGKALDHRTDVYSLGVTLYELLTLNVPFAGSTAQKLYHSIVNEEPPRPGLANPTLPRDLETICLTATEKRPDRRFQSAHEFAEDLRRFLRFEPVHARPIGNLTRSVRWLRRNLASAVIGVLGFSTVATVLIYFMTTLSMRALLDDAEAKRVEAARKMTAAESEAQRAEQRAAAAAHKTADANDKTRQAEQLATAARQRTTELDGDIQRLEGEKARARDQITSADLRLQQIGQQLQDESENLRRQRLQFTVLQGEKASLVQEKGALQTEIRTTVASLGDLTQSHKITTINRLLMEAGTLRQGNPGLGLILAGEAARRAESVDPKHQARLDPTLQARVDDTLLDLLRICQEQLTFTAHQHPVAAVAVAPSGRQIISASIDGTVYLWNRHNRRMIHKRQRMRTVITHLEFVDEHRVLLADEAGGMFLWDTASNDNAIGLAALRHDAATRHHVSSDHKYVVAHARDQSNQLRLLDLDAPQRPLPIGGAMPFRHFVFHPGGRGIAGITTDKRVQVYEFGKPDLVLDQDCEVNPLAMAFDRSGRRLAWLEENGRVRIVNVDDAAILLDARLNDGYLLGTGQLAFCDDDRKLLVTGTAAPSHYLLDATDGRLIAEIPAAGDHREFTLSPDDAAVACIARQEGGFYLFHTASGRVIAQLNGHQPGSARQPPRVAFTPVGRSLVTAQGDNTVRLWHTSPGGSISTLGPGMSDLRLTSNGETFTRARFAADGEHLLVVSNLGASRWHRQTGRRTHSLPHRSDVPTNPQMIADDGATVVCPQDRGAREIRGGRIRKLQLPTPPGRQIEHITTWPRHRVALTYSGSTARPRRQLQVINAAGETEFSANLPDGLSGGGVPLPSPDGQRYCVGYDDLWILHASRGDRGIRLPFSQRPAVFAPDGRSLAASTGFSVRVWDASSGRPQFDLADLPVDYSQLTTLSYSADGARLATAWSDGSIRVHDTSRTDGRLLLSFQAHRLRIRSLMFSADGKHLVSASDDGTTRVWYSADGRRRLSFAPGKPCRFACFDAGAEFVLTVCDETLHVFPLALRRLADRAPRQLTAAERQRFGL